ncbi:4-alpha-glucanotransferase [Sulfurifustis variabilis]|uniref:4-alpha-glucanotransferase n=1 Tax=Sulfurifustis variabilis TaxID=1675686 RepID=A0A1B4V3C8_9GAMM|nr:malto-oligosyltrehalose synthase [Sulfurifustis variabilis]BAU48063.1 4-alpha-glucanotransferase [Sulfurifustis variabilis]
MIDPALERLCALCGIEPRYHDIWGREHAVTRDVVQALVAAMGVDLANGMEPAIAEIEDRPWRRLLPPVRVIVASENDREVVLRLPEERAQQKLAYTIALENGERRGDEIVPANLAVRERRTIDGRAHVACALPLPELPLGYHRLEADAGEGPVIMELIVAPPACYVPDAVADAGRVFGPAIQLYALRSQRNWGMGDFTDLRHLVERAAERGAGVVGLNPLHALYPHNPAHASPYSPSSRLFLNVLYLDIEAIPEFVQCGPAQQLVYASEFQRRLRLLREGEYVDYPGVAAAKFEALEVLYPFFREHHLARNTPRARAFRAFQQAGGEWLRRQAVYEALQEHLHRRDPAIWGWPVWPEEYRDPTAEAVAAFAREQEARVEFYEYLQWQADRQLAACGRRSWELGLGVGLYTDLAVSVDRGGSETWALSRLYAKNISIGAPPDELALQGQNWGLPPLVPRFLTEEAYAPFIATLRENMRHAGALRIDHVMGLMRLFWVPEGRSAQDGAYVRYPLADMLGVLALESVRNRCLVIGEDLGTVPDEVRAALAPMNVLSYRLFYFEREKNGDFKAPETYPAKALAAVSTHDLPTLSGFWKGQDLTERDRLNLFPSQEMREQQILQRTQDRARLLMALSREGLLPDGMSVDPASAPEMTPPLARAVHLYLARTPSKLMMLQLEDALGELRQANLPGTVEEHPNWRRKLALDLDDLFEDARVERLFDALRELRGPGAVAREVPRPGGAVIPDATYRLQFNRDYTFRHAAALAPYLRRLGVSHCYASPYLKARPGSRHGYDIVDHNALNPEIGSDADYEAFVEALQREGLGQILDIVPNHMGVGSDNGWWLDVLENGPASVYAAFFDIDWRPLKAELRGKVLLPVLGDHYGTVLESGQLRLAVDRSTGAFCVQYFDHRFPVDPGTYPQILQHDRRQLEEALGASHPRLLEYEALLNGFRHLPPRHETSQDLIIERHRDKEVHKRRLAELMAAEPAIAAHVEGVLRLYNGGDHAPARPDLLHELLEGQAYRVAFWRTAADEINYRRFFDINDLAGLRQENRQTFHATHRLVADLVAQGKVNGLRIDHPDGLYDPLDYYRRLQSLVAVPATGREAGSSARQGLYVVTEKILAAYERLPDDWPVHGTTGYEFANLVNGLFVYPAGEDEIDRTYQKLARRPVDFDELLADRKRLIMRVALSSELNVLAYRLNRISESDWHARDFTLNALRDALRDVVALFPVYRTYVRGGRIAPDDRRYIEWAVAQAKKRSPAADVSVFDFVRRVLLLEGQDEQSPEYRDAVLDFAMRFQQYTAPVMAKGLEDTSFYIYNRLTSLNEVGGDPRRFGTSVAAFHHANQERARRWPHTMLATSTHDTKRSEDVRARLDVLSELGSEWRERVSRWARLNRGRKRRLDEEFAPDRNDEYLLYQTLVGAWPLGRVGPDGLAAFRARIEEYMLKAVREAKVHTSWINPNTEYEEAVRGFVQGVLTSEGNLFFEDFVPFTEKLVRYGLYNGLSQVLLKLTVPGMPDIYQGTELWDFSLVDPDNRRPVDYALRDRLLRELETGMTPGGEQAARARALLETIDDGRAKLYLTWKTLTHRRGRSQLYREGEYLPLAVEGSRSEHLCAFARRSPEGTIVVLAPRWFARLAPEGELPLGTVWEETRVQLPGEGRYTNLYTGEALSPKVEGDRCWLDLAGAFAHFPVALLELAP